MSEQAPTNNGLVPSRTDIAVMSEQELLTAMLAAREIGKRCGIMETARWIALVRGQPELALGVITHIDEICDAKPEEP